MKLATYRDGSRDGQLIVVSRDLTLAHYATGIASRLQQVLDDWGFMGPQLEDLSVQLNAGRARHAFAFDPMQCMAPLPRTSQRLVATAGASATAHPSDPGPALPSLRQASGDNLLGPCEPIEVAGDGWGIDFGAGIAVIAGDLRRGVAPEQAIDGIRLLMLANDVGLHALAPATPAGEFDALQAWPATAFGPVAITPDELGDSWQGGRMHLTLQCGWNGRRVGLCETAEGMELDFGQLLARLAGTRAVRAGCIVGSGALRPPAPDADGRHERSRGHASLAQKRAAEFVQDGRYSTGFMKPGDTLRIEAKGRDGRPVFGAIEQQVVASAGAGGAAG